LAASGAEMQKRRGSMSQLSPVGVLERAGTSGAAESFPVGPHRRTVAGSEHLHHKGSGMPQKRHTTAELLSDLPGADQQHADSFWDTVMTTPTSAGSIHIKDSRLPPNLSFAMGSEVLEGSRRNPTPKGTGSLAANHSFGGDDGSARTMMALMETQPVNPAAPFESSQDVVAHRQALLMGMSSVSSGTAGFGHAEIPDFSSSMSFRPRASEAFSAASLLGDRLLLADVASNPTEDGNSYKGGDSFHRQAGVESATDLLAGSSNEAFYSSQDGRSFLGDASKLNAYLPQSSAGVSRKSEGLERRRETWHGTEMSDFNVKSPPPAMVTVAESLLDTGFSPAGSAGGSPKSAVRKRVTIAQDLDSRRGSSGDGAVSAGSLPAREVLNRILQVCDQDSSGKLDKRDLIMSLLSPSTISAACDAPGAIRNGHGAVGSRSGSPSAPLPSGGQGGAPGGLTWEEFVRHMPPDKAFGIISDACKPGGGAASYSQQDKDRTGDVPLGVSMVARAKDFPDAALKRATSPVSCFASAFPKPHYCESPTGFVEVRGLPLEEHPDESRRKTVSDFPDRDLRRGSLTSTVPAVEPASSSPYLRDIRSPAFLSKGEGTPIRDERLPVRRRPSGEEELSLEQLSDDSRSPMGSRRASPRPSAANGGFVGRIPRDRKGPQTPGVPRVGSTPILPSSPVCYTPNSFAAPASQLQCMGVVTPSFSSSFVPPPVSSVPPIYLRARSSSPLPVAYSGAPLSPGPPTSPQPRNLLQASFVSPRPSFPASARSMGGSATPVHVAGGLVNVSPIPHALMLAPIAGFGDGQGPPRPIPLSMGGQRGSRTPTKTVPHPGLGPPAGLAATLRNVLDSAQKLHPLSSPFKRPEPMRQAAACIVPLPKDPVHPFAHMVVPSVHALVSPGVPGSPLSSHRSVSQPVVATIPRQFSAHPRCVHQGASSPSLSPQPHRRLMLSRSPVGSPGSSQPRMIASVDNLGSSVERQPVKVVGGEPFPRQPNSGTPLMGSVSTVASWAPPPGPGVVVLPTGLAPTSVYAAPPPTSVYAAPPKSTDYPGTAEFLPPGKPSGSPPAGSRVAENDFLDAAGASSAAVEALLAEAMLERHRASGPVPSSQVSPQIRSRSFNELPGSGGGPRVGAELASSVAGYAGGDGWRRYPYPCVFRKALSSVERAYIEAFLEPHARDTLEEHASREFDWAVQSGGSVPGVANRMRTALDYAGALTAFRQLNYLGGLPALDHDAARWFFNVHCTSGAEFMLESNGAGPQGVGSCLSLDEFRAAYVHLLRTALIVNGKPSASILASSSSAGIRGGVGSNGSASALFAAEGSISLLPQHSP